MRILTRKFKFNNIIPEDFTPVFYSVQCAYVAYPFGHFRSYDYKRTRNSKSFHPSLILPPYRHTRFSRCNDHPRYYSQKFMYRNEVFRVGWDILYLPFLLLIFFFFDFFSSMQITNLSIKRENS